MFKVNNKDTRTPVVKRHLMSFLSIWTCLPPFSSSSLVYFEPVCYLIFLPKFKAIIYRSSFSKMFFKISVIKNFGVPFSIKLWAFPNFIKKKLQHMCFPVNIAKILRTLFHRKPLVAAFPSIHSVYLSQQDPGNADSVRLLK